MYLVRRKYSLFQNVILLIFLYLFLGHLSFLFKNLFVYLFLFLLLTFCLFSFLIIFSFYIFHFSFFILSHYFFFLPLIFFSLISLSFHTILLTSLSLRGFLFQVLFVMCRDQLCPLVQGTNYSGQPREIKYSDPQVSLSCLRERKREDKRENRQNREQVGRGGLLLLDQSESLGFGFEREGERETEQIASC